METIVAEARQKDYVETLFHRRRYLPEIHSSNFNIRSFAEKNSDEFSNTRNSCGYFKSSYD